MFGARLNMDIGDPSHFKPEGLQIGGIWVLDFQQSKLRVSWSSLASLSIQQYYIFLQSYLNLLLRIDNLLFNWILFLVIFAISANPRNWDLQYQNFQRIGT